LASEIYGNLLTNHVGTNAALYHRGGKALFFYNNFDAGDYWTIKFRDWVADEVCDQPYNAASGQPQHISHSYVFNNRRSDNSLTPLNSGLDTDAEINCCANDTDYNCKETYCQTEETYAVKRNREWWIDSTSYPTSDGTEGVGCGTTLPATCTPGTASAADGGASGPGFWVTSQSCTNTTGLVGASTAVTGGTRTPSSEISGALYVCTSTDTWTEYYTPYTYPHPLRSEAAPDETAPTFLSSVLGTDGQTFTISFTESGSSVIKGTSWADGHWTADTNDVEGTDIPLLYVSGTGTNTWTFKSGIPINRDATVTITFDGTADVMGDEDANDLGAISAESVTNNSQKVPQRGIAISNLRIISREYD